MNFFNFLWKKQKETKSTPKKTQDLEKTTLPIEKTENRSYKPYKELDEEDVLKRTIKKDESDTDGSITEVESVISKIFYKPRVNKKLTIILVENTDEVSKEKDKVYKIIKNAAFSGMLCIINYGTNCRISEIEDVLEFDCTDFLFNEDVGTDSCLYDALVALDGLFIDKHIEKIETEKEIIEINDIEVIGIGTCIDNCSHISKEFGIDSFSKVLGYPNVTSKYFCLTEKSFLQVAEIGFHSIGSMSQKYQ